MTAQARLLGDDQLAPGAEGWVQFRLSEPLNLVKGDRFIVRLPSPSITLGGGTVVDAHPTHRHRRFKPQVTARLETLARGSPSEILLQALDAAGPVTVADLLKTSRTVFRSSLAVVERVDYRPAMCSMLSGQVDQSAAQSNDHLTRGVGIAGSDKVTDDLRVLSQGLSASTRDAARGTQEQAGTNAEVLQRRGRRWP